MSIVRELELCPHCLEKIYREIAKCQNKLKESPQKGQGTETEVKEVEKDEKKRKCGREGAYRMASKEEVDKCLASLPYIVPICDYCKLHRNISILKLPATSYIVQKPGETPNPK